ncbi:MAG: hypothetical protein V4556_09735 [Bacteroidota bacterium]
MNRRNFLTKSSLALFATAGLPKGRKKKSPTTASTFKSKLLPGTADQVEYEMLIDNFAISVLSNPSVAEKTIVIRAKHYGTDLKTPDKSVEINHMIESSTEVTEGTDKIWVVKTKYDKFVSGDDKMAKQFPKDMVLKGKTYNYFNLMGKKDKVIAKVEYVSPPSTDYGDDDDCFLTTACVRHKQLADDCDELMTLRFLRDTYMINDFEAALLVKNYKIVGPKLIQAINQFENKTEVYNYIYDQLVMPSVKMIKKNEYAEATAYYKDFVEGMSNKYL